MAKKQRMYTPEFRQQMVELIQAGRTYEDLEKESGCTGWSILKWVKKADRDSGRGDGGQTNDEREEQPQLQRENWQLKLEREILLKAAA